MAIFLSLLLHLLLQNTVFAEGGDRFFLTVTNQTQGVEVRVFPDANASKDWPDYKEIEIKGHYLAPECGEDFDKCGMVVIANNSASAAKREQSFVLTLPLVKTLGLLRLTVEGTGLKKEVVTIDLSDQQYDCSPTSLYNIQNRYFIVCVNADLNNVKLVELKLNATHPTDYWLATDCPHTESVHNLTNSVYVNLPSQSGHVIYFATGYEVFYFWPLHSAVSQLDIDLQGQGCFATSIDYIGEWEMLVYCDNNRAVYVDINSESIFATAEFNKDGQPYVCPNRDVYLAVYTEQRYIKYAFWSTKQAEDFQLSGRKFDNGICSGSQNVTLFAFTDKERGTQLLNASEGSIRSLSDTTCINYPCQPLVMLQDRYLVIREKRGVSWYISVLDSNSNFSLVLEARYTKADLMAIVEDIHKQDNVHRSPQDSDGTPIIPLIVGGSALILSIILILAVVLVIIFYLVHKKKARAHHSTTVLQTHEQRHDMTEELVHGIGCQGKGSELEREKLLQLHT